MDVPPPSDDEDEGGADLTLEASDDDILAETRGKRRAPETVEERERENVVLGRLKRAVGEMRKIFKRHKAPQRPPEMFTEPESIRRGRQRLIPTLDIPVEMAAVSPVLRAMAVAEALRLGKALRAVRELLWGDDEMWMHWWFRDFPEMARDMGNAAAGLPSWITENSWKRDLHPGIDSPKVVALACLPWRCWYQWSTFFRRSALHHIAKIQNAAGRYYLDTGQHVEEEDEESSDEYRPSNVTTWGTLAKLIVPPFDQDTGVAHGLVLVDEEEPKDVYFPEEMFETSHNITREPTAESAVVAAARSPVFWLLRYVQQQADYSYDASTAFVKTWESTLSSRKIPKHLLLGGTSEMISTGRLNFNYTKAMMLYCSWYTAALVQGGSAVLGFVQSFAPLRNEFPALDIEQPQRFWAAKLAQILPAFPAVDGVWFVGERVAPAVPSLLPFAFGAVACVGCHATGELGIRCKKCKKGYCGSECHKKNWHRACAGCAKK
jgi:hypothetical protein